MTRGKPSTTCGDHGGNRRDGRPCSRPEGWGTDFDTGRCKECKGVSPDGSHENHGAPEGNLNGVTHGLYADENMFYQKIMTDKQRALCDEIFQDYCTKFREINGEPNTGEQARLFEISVNHIKIIRADNWMAERPSELRSGNPLVDKEQRYNAEGVPYDEFKESVVLAGQKKLRNEDRKWLKEMDLVGIPDEKSFSSSNLADLVAEHVLEGSG